MRRQSYERYRVTRNIIGWKEMEVWFYWDENKNWRHIWIEQSEQNLREFLKIRSLCFGGSAFHVFCFWCSFCFLSHFSIQLSKWFYNDRDDDEVAFMKSSAWNRRWYRWCARVLDACWWMRKSLSLCICSTEEWPTTRTRYFRIDSEEDRIRKRSTNTYLDFDLIRISTCSWKSVTISLCFFFIIMTDSSDSKWTSSRSFLNFDNSKSRLQLAWNWKEGFLELVLEVSMFFVSIFCRFKFFYFYFRFLKVIFIWFFFNFKFWIIFFLFQVWLLWILWTNILDFDLNTMFFL